MPSINEIKQKKIMGLFSSAGDLMEVRADYAQTMIEYYQRNKYVIREPETIAEREAWRIKANLYIAVPSWFPTKPEHYVIKNPENTELMYFRNERDCERDVRTSVRAGRYLQLFFPDLANLNQIVERWNATFTDNELMFASKADEIVDVITNGPTSCMTYPFESYKKNGAVMHPYAVIGDSDLQVAYIRENGRIVARAIVYPEKKTYNYISGSSRRMEKALRAAGYSEGKLVGAKFPIVLNDKKDLVTAPSIDNNRFVYMSDDNYWVICEPQEATHSLSNVSGVVQFGTLCDHTGKYYNITVLVDGQQWSSPKAKVLAVKDKLSYNQWTSKETAIRLPCGGYTSKKNFDRLYTICAGSGKAVEKTQTVELKGLLYSIEHIRSRIEEQFKQKAA